ncbi:hypothetical protein LIER_02671 [Lithospermum erythrorhizon]|uniref:Uncharacterized protein n=1 Tax=Lithospermum erythrorhizon TaxID=34254 RepID=A0AAV3NRT9_LITER
MVNTLKKRSEAKEVEKVGMNKRGELVPLQSIPPSDPVPETAPLQPPPILLFPWKDEVNCDEHDSRGKRVKRVLRKQGAPVKFVRDEVPSPMKEDDDIIIVSSTASRRRTRSSVAALEKKKAALGLGGDPDESMEHSTTVDLEEFERKVEERKRSRKGKRASGVKESGEFICNLSEEITDPASPMFHKVKLRGYVFKFSPTLINKHCEFRDEGATGATLKLGDIIEELIGKALTAWHTKGQLQASHLSLSFGQNVTEALGRMLYVMWTEHVLNVEKIIFDQIVDYAKTGVKLKPIGFPSLICSMPITQHPTVLKKEDGLGEDAKPLIISDKLMKWKHVLDVQFNEADQPNLFQKEKLQTKIHALMSRVPPAVNASADHPVPVATTFTNPPAGDETSTPPM